MDINKQGGCKVKITLIIQRGELVVLPMRTRAMRAVDDDLDPSAKCVNIAQGRVSG